MTSGILLQRFLTGSASPVSQQILLRGQPTSFDQAVESVKEVEYALNFAESAAPKEINVLSWTVGTSTLSIGEKPRYHVLMFMAQQQTTCDSVAVTAPVDMEIPGRTIQLIQGELQGEYNNISEALVEPASGAPPTNLCVARTLTPVQSGKEVILQVMNVSPTPVTIYKGMKLGKAIPRHHVLMVNDDVNKVASMPTSQLQASDFNLDRSDLSPSETRQLLTQFTDLFAPKGGPVGRTPNVKHSIPTERPPVRQPLQRIPEALKGAVDAEVTKMLEQGVVQPSSSPWSSPIVMVKKDGSWCFCVDYRKLNSVTHQDAYPLPRIDATLDSLSGAAYFTTLDLASGYWQVEVEEQDKEKTAFRFLRAILNSM